MAIGWPAMRLLVFLLLTCCVAMSASPVLAQTTRPALSEADAPGLPRPKVWLGDFDGMKERRLIRILVPFSRTIYFVDQGAERGTAAEFGREFEKWLNKKYETRALKILVAFIPTARDRLLSALKEGAGDIVAANLTITPERLQLVDFSAPAMKNVKEVVVTGPRAPMLAGLDALAGQEIHVRMSSSYWGHLQALGDELKAKGLKEIALVPADEDLEEKTWWKWSMLGFCLSSWSTATRPRSGQRSSPA
jgi:ABC-type amino acid transport substrate-binding protein